MQARRVAALVAACLLAALPAARAADSSPAGIVAWLYAAEFEPQPAYAARLSALFEADSARVAGGGAGHLRFDWITGDQDVPLIEKLVITTLALGSAEASVRASFLNYGNERVRTVRFVRLDGVWAIDDVMLDVPEGASLSSILEGR